MFLSIGECMIELSQAGDGLLRKGFAGDTLNTAWYARAGLPEDWKVEYFTAVGEDLQSQEMVNFIRSSGIGTSHIRSIQGSTPGLYMISLDAGERSFTYWRENSAARQLASDRDRIHAAIGAADIVYVSGITLAILDQGSLDHLLDQMRHASASGKTVAFDPNIRPRLWKSGEALRNAVERAAQASTIVMPSFDDERTHFGDGTPDETASRYLAFGAETVVVKNGEAGVTVATRHSKVFVAAYPVSAVADTTGAGDSFNGAFLSQICVGVDALEAARFAAKVAATVVREHGALVPFDRLPPPIDAGRFN
jgi:2-dehydro-3-deoxygluconokinase